MYDYITHAFKRMCKLIDQNTEELKIFKTIQVYNKKREREREIPGGKILAYLFNQSTTAHLELESGVFHNLLCRLMNLTFTWYLKMHSY